MKTTNENAIHFPKVVSPTEWQKARDALMVKEKKATRDRDALAAERRRLPMVRIDQKYTFDTPSGKKSLLDLFEGRRQLIMYHFMFAPPVNGWPDAGCVGCSMVTDQFGNMAHLNARDTSFCLVSVAPLKNIEKFKKRMGWTFPWYSSEGTSFNRDFGLTTDNGEIFGLSVFIRDDEGNVYRTYHTGGRGTEGLTNGTLLDLTPLGRQEEWEDSPNGGRHGKPFTWWRRHDEYEQESAGKK
jgi:predicted dithiol-disulfide oxidoreductase (DUF899 family)